MASQGKPTSTATCACRHVACAHVPGQCPNGPVGMERPLGVETALCETCASRWGFRVRAEGPGARPATPIGGRELDQLEAKSGVVGLSTVDVRRLLANYRRLRQLVLDTQAHVPDNQDTRTLDLPKRLKDESDLD